MNVSSSFSSSSTSCFTSLNSRTSRNSRLTSFNSRTSRNSRLFQYISSIIRTRFSSFRLFDNNVKNSLFINSFLFSNCSSSFNFAFSFNSSLHSTRFQSSEEQKSNSKKESKSNSKKKRISLSITKKSSIVEKTQIVLKYMKNIRLTIFHLIQEVVETSSIQKNQLIRKSDLIRSLLTNSRDILNSVNWDQKEYKKKLRSISKSRYFKKWKVENINLLETNSTTVIEKIENRALHLLTLFRFITATIDQRFDRRDMKDKWIIMIFILCFIYKSRTCVRWSTMWRIQLHANEIKRRVIECLYHIDLTIKYKSVLSFFRELAQFQRTSLKMLSVEKNFIIT
jgi:hypothetical protein